MNDLPIDWEMLAVMDECEDMSERVFRGKKISKQALRRELTAINDKLTRLASLSEANFGKGNSLLTDLWDAVHYTDSAINKLNDELLPY